MGYHRYKMRDFRGAEVLVTLRKRALLTQEEVALWMGVTTKTIGNWEGGMNHPSEPHLRKLTEFYLDKHVFTTGQEQDEARQFWGQLRECAPRRIGIFDEQWFAALLIQWQTRSRQAHHLEKGQPTEQLGTPEQQPPASLAVLTVANQDTPPSRTSPRLLQGEWSDVPNVSAFHGRTGELAELEQWLLKDQCQLVAVLGMGGIGKTSLVVKLVQQVVPHFACVLWCSLHNAPSLEDLLRDWLSILANQHNTLLPQREEPSLSVLIQWLRERRCLLVLDNLETLFQEGMLEGRFREGYEGYATLIQQAAETRHQSCLLLASRELSPDLRLFTDRQGLVRVFRLGGLPLPASQQMLHDKGLFGEQATWSELVQRYAGNPLALKIVAEIVDEVFGGDIAAFLAEGSTTFQGLRQLLAQQFERLSPLEQALMYWLAIEREPVTLKTLLEDLIQIVEKSEMIEAMHSLRSRSLVERGVREAVFALQPVILEYMTERLVTLVSDEILEGKPGLLLQYALLKGQAKDYVRASQARLILQAVLDRLVLRFGTGPDLERQFALLLQQLRSLPRTQQGYGGGNVVNFLIQLNGHVKGKDCSRLTVWQAHMQGAEAQDANFAGSDLRGSVFLETMDAIPSVAVSVDGHYIAAGGYNGEIRLWRVTDGQLLRAWGGHSRQVWSLAFHPEGSWLVSGGYDGLVKVWDVRTGQCVRILQGHTRWVHSLAIHPTGTLLASCSDDGSIRVWDLLANDATSIWHQQESGIWSLAFSPDGRFLASGDVQGVIKLWDLESRRCLWSVTAHSRSEEFSQSAIPSIVFSPNSQVLVSGGQDATIRVWETSSGAHLCTLVGHTAIVQSLAFHAEGVLASGSEDGSVKLWQVGPREEASYSLGTLHGHTGMIWSLAFGPNGLLVSGGQEGLIKIWQINREDKGGRCLRTLRGHSRMMNAVAFSPDGRLLISSEQNGTVRMWETASGRCLRILSRQGGGVFALAFSPDGRLFASGVFGKLIQLWDVESGQCLKTLQGHQEHLWSLAFSPDGGFLVSGSLDTTIKRWEVESGRCLGTLQGHRNWVWCMAYSPDGKLLASGDVDGVVKIWEVESGRCLHTLHGSPQAIVALRFTQDGQTLLSSNAQDLMTMWDVQRERCLKIIPGIGDTYWLRSVALSADGNLVAARSHDQTIKIWDIKRGEIVYTLPCPAGQPWSVALSADQRLLACGTDEGSIMLWKVQPGEHLVTLRGDRPYERMNINGVTGITEARKASLKSLGAIEKDAQTNH